MAEKSTASRLNRIIGVALAACAMAASQATISLEEATARSESDFAPVMDGRTVAVRGQVSSHPIQIFGYSHLPMQDKDQGIVLEGRPETFAELTPGDWIEARGRMVNRSGLPVLVVTRINIESAGARPLPKPAPPGDLLTFRYLGQLVSTEDRVLEIGENAEGVFLRIGEVEAPLKVFMPQPQGATRSRFADVRIGDKVRVTGVAYQYCPTPPYDRHFEILVDKPSAVEVVSQNWMMEVWALRPLVMALVVGAAIWYWRERRAREQREILRRMYTLSEDILDSSSPADILSRIEAVLPKVLRITSSRLYLYDRGTRTLVPVSPTDQRTDPSVPLDGPSGFFESGLVNAFQNRIMVTIGDTKRGQFGLASRDKTNMLMPRSLVYVPMLSQGESVGVMQMENSRQARNFSDDEKASAQHLANQVGLALKLLQQRSFRDQLARSEKLAAVGRLISGVVNDLQTPLAAITGMAESALEKDPETPDSHELLVIASEAKRAAAIVSRLVSFAQPEQVRPEPVDLIGLLRGLIRFREREWKACGIHLRNMLKEQKLYVLAAQGQIEQVFLNLLVHAEQALEEVAEKRIQVRGDVLAKRIFVEIRYSAPAPRATGRGESQSLESEINSLGLDVSRTIITGHGGEMRLTRPSDKESCFEIELPLMQVDKPVEPAAVESRDISRKLTAVLIEPEEWVERQLMESLGVRGYRVVPVHSSDEALDLIGRLRFDVVFCSTQLEGLNWVEFYDRVRGRVGAFTLLAEVFSHDLSMHFQGEGRYMVLKPIEKAQFERTLEAVESRVAAQASSDRTPELESYS